MGPPSVLPPRLSKRSSRCVTIGLINNMPQAAFKATERQFISLLESASEDITVGLSLYALPGVPRTAGDYGDGCYSSVETLWDKRLDGLIVTGREASTANLSDEPYWESFTEVLEWARVNTYSTVWSCLAAHAAVLHMDGIRRQKSGDKHFGLYECAPASRHRLTAGASPRFQIPHSRWNGLAEDDLAARGYSVLTRSADAQVDTFVKQDNSLFVFFQGHPEYESDTLLREYRRDAGRFLRHDADTYPSIPRGYFDPGTEATLTALRARALSSRSKDLLASVSTALDKSKIENTWRSTATQIYRNWLLYLCAQKTSGPRDDSANATDRASN
jgi:homoserine O-succinyltransferase